MGRLPLAAARRGVQGSQREDCLGRPAMIKPQGWQYLVHFSTKRYHGGLDLSTPSPTRLQSVFTISGGGSVLAHWPAWRIGVTWATTSSPQNTSSPARTCSRNLRRWFPSLQATEGVLKLTTKQWEDCRKSWWLCMLFAMFKRADTEGSTSKDLLVICQESSNQ